MGIAEAIVDNTHKLKYTDNDFMTVLGTRGTRERN